MNALRNFTISVAFSENLLSLAIFENFKFFSENPKIFLNKNPSFERFETYDYSSSILRQIYYKLVEKISHPSKHRFNATLIGKQWVKNAPIWEEDFVCHVLKKMAQNHKHWRSCVLDWFLGGSKTLDHQKKYFTIASLVFLWKSSLIPARKFWIEKLINPKATSKYKKVQFTTVLGFSWADSAKKCNWFWIS